MAGRTIVITGASDGIGAAAARALIASQATVIQAPNIAARLFARPDLDDLDAEHGYSARPPRVHRS